MEKELAVNHRGVDIFKEGDRFTFYYDGSQWHYRAIRHCRYNIDCMMDPTYPVMNPYKD